MKRVYLIILTTFIASIFVVSNIALADGESKEEKVKCAYDGMEMSKNSMKAKMKYQGKMYYFCTKKEKDKFAEDPERYLKRENDSESQYEKGKEMHHDNEGMYHNSEMHEGHGNSSYGSQGHETGSHNMGHGSMGRMH
jgi:YHS domain-containing protein